MIKNIVFDFGDVFINLDKEATFRRLKKLGVKEFTDDLLELGKQYEMGMITTHEFVKTFKTLFPSISEIDFKNAWNSMLLDFPPHRLSFLKSLAYGGSVNNNPIISLKLSGLNEPSNLRIFSDKYCSVIYLTTLNDTLVKEMNNNQLFDMQQKKLRSQDKDIDEIVGYAKEGREINKELSKELLAQNRQLDNIDTDVIN